MYEMHQSVSQGVVSEDLAIKSPSNLRHTRWLTTANRVLRLYVTSETPSDNLLSLVNFIMNAYASILFCIKSDPFVKDGPKLVCRTLQLVKKQEERIKSIVISVI